MKRLSVLCLLPLLLAGCAAKGPPPPQHVFDIPGLLQMHIRHVQAQLGPPFPGIERSPYLKDNLGITVWRRDGVQITAVYDRWNGEVHRISLSPESREYDVPTRDKEYLMSFGQLEEGSDQYKLKFQSASSYDPDEYFTVVAIKTRR